MASELQGKVAVVTGGAQGIGAAYAKALAASGARVAVADLREADALVAQIAAAGGAAISVATDVRDPASVRRMIAATLEAFDGLDILINNAAKFGDLRIGSFEDISSAEWDEVCSINVRGVFECCKAAVPEMRKRGGGKIVNVASATVFKGAPNLLHYVTSKGGVIALTRALAREVGRDGICVNCLAPGLTLSESVLANNSYDAAYVQRNTATRALAREASPDDLVGPMLFLCSPASNFMTGQTIVADGGSVMH